LQKIILQTSSIDEINQELNSDPLYTHEFTQLSNINNEDGDDDDDEFGTQFSSSSTKDWLNDMI
jgi:hypothetical protein